MKFLPELLKFKDGTQVTNENWKERREEIVDILRHEQYGYSPEKPANVGEYFKEGDISYCLRDGLHYLSRHDWLKYMEFFKKIM